MSISKVSHPHLQQMIGQSPCFTAEMAKISVVASSDASVLILGETGTGKELCAQRIHGLSPRAQKPFVPVNCGAIPRSLIEGELFGHARGAYTSASTSQTGLIHEADAGTLFLDEIVTLRESSQAKLLRFLQEREYRPLGSSKTCQADVRVISASNVDIEKAVREGTLRRDLYYRLNVVSIQLPSLRERRDDIPLLARHFLVQYAARLKKNLTDFSPEAMRRLVLHDWPGNVRELEHSVHRAVVLTDHATIEPGDVFLPELEAARDHKSFQGAKAEAISQFEIDFITKLLVAHQGNITRAAKAAKKNRRAFWELIRKHGIDANRFRSHNS